MCDEESKKYEEFLLALTDSIIESNNSTNETLSTCVNKIVDRLDKQDKIIKKMSRNNMITIGMILLFIVLSLLIIGLLG